MSAAATTIPERAINTALTWDLSNLNGTSVPIWTINGAIIIAPKELITDERSKSFGKTPVHKSTRKPNVTTSSIGIRAREIIERNSPTPISSKTNIVVTTGSLNINILLVLFYFNFQYFKCVYLPFTRSIKPILKKQRASKLETLPFIKRPLYALHILITWNRHFL